jgi:hypothetical protein
MIRCNHISAFPDEYLALFEPPRNGQQDTIREFINKIEQRTGTQGIVFRSDDDRMKFKGDVLEVLSELFFTRFNSDPALGLTDYTPVRISEDFGVDAKGINANGDTAVVQVKYRCNPSELIEYTDISKTFTSGILRHRLNPAKDHTVFVFTTASDVNWVCKQEFGSKLVVVNRPIIARAIDNNRNFWPLCFEEVQQYVSYHTGDSFAI